MIDTKKKGQLTLWEKRKRRRKYALMMFLAILIFLVGMGIFVGVYFKTEKITVTGNKTYTEDEIKKAVMSDGYISNTLLMAVKSRVRPKTYFPFVEHVTMTFHEPQVLEIKVTEKVRVGIIQQGDEYMYFNLAGEVIEQNEVLFDNIPILEDAEIGKAKVGEKIPVSEEHQKEIVQTVRGIANKGLTVSEIRLDEDGKITLVCDTFNVLIGSSNYIDAKIAKVPELLKAVQAKYKSGTINMQLYTESNELITFYK